MRADHAVIHTRAVRWRFGGLRAFAREHEGEAFYAMLRWISLAALLFLVGPACGSDAAGGGGKKGRDAGGAGDGRDGGGGRDSGGGRDGGSGRGGDGGRHGAIGDGSDGRDAATGDDRDGGGGSGDGDGSNAGGSDASRGTGGDGASAGADGGGPVCTAQCLSRECGTVVDSCGKASSCGTCLADEGCAGEGACLLPGTVDDFGSCDTAIYSLEGRKGHWYFYRGADVGCTPGSCNGVSAPPWGSACGAWTQGGATGTANVYAGMGVGLNEGGPTYDACSYDSVEVSYSSDQSVRMYAKWGGTGATSPRASVVLGATVGTKRTTVALSSFAGLVCSTLTELQFEPTNISGFGIAVYAVRLRSAGSGDCANGATRCTAGGGIELCKGGVWTPSTCPNGSCVSDRCVASTATPVEIHGHLSVNGSRLVDQAGNDVQLKGVSSHWLNYEEDGYALDPTALIWMRDNWKVSLIRAAMGVNAAGGYLDSAAGKAAMLGQVETIIANAAAAGVYVLVDWHSHDAQTQQASATVFFADIAKRYGHLPNVLFETFNEPLNVSWATVLKPYHQAVVTAIRDNDPDGHPNVVILGTPNWDQDVDVAAASPLSGTNLMYTLHFYSCSHNAASGHLARAQSALAAGLPIFVTEWGATAADGGVGGTPACLTEADAWHAWMDQNDIGWAAWKLDDCDYELATSGVADTSCILKLNAPKTGGWTSAYLQGHGPYVVDKLKN
jgi:endoglucanase